MPARAQLKCVDLLNDTPEAQVQMGYRAKINHSYMPSLETYKLISVDKLSELVMLENGLKPGEALSVLEAQGVAQSAKYFELVNFLETKSLVKPLENVDIFKAQRDTKNTLLDDLRVVDSKQLELFKRTGLLHDSFDADITRWDRNSDLAFTVGTQSRSIVRRELGTDVIRSYTWLKVGGSKPGEVNLDRVRIARNYRKNGEPFSLEMLINDGTEWKAYFFEMEGTYWRLKEKIHDKNVEQVCARYHISMGVGAIAKGKMAPRPFFMKDEAVWFRSGFKDKNLVKRMLKF
ncbi:hypothetical protein K2P97_13630 [bacterium]|nr:hypothetical protein [bacterium]